MKQAVIQTYIQLSHHVDSTEQKKQCKHAQKIEIGQIN